MQRRITPRLHEAGVASWLLRYRARGWNGSGTGPQEDAHWALEQVRASYGEVPVVLLGHSMGTRTAAYVDMGRVGHYMLRRVEAWNAAAADGALGLAARI